MKVTLLRMGLVLATLLLAGCEVFPQSQPPQFSVVIPTAEEEVEYVWGLLKDIKFYNDNNYKLTLPETPVFDELLKKAYQGLLKNSDKNRLRQEFIDVVYNQEDYQEGHAIVTQALEVANSKVAVFADYHEKWGFYLPRNYQVVLTLYGPGGAYNSRTGNIIMRTTSDGRFVNGDNPLQIMLHEATHIGLEEPIVRKWNLEHWTKERLVDRFMVAHFADVCPDYKIQTSAVMAIESIFDQADAWDNLPERVGQFVRQQN